MFDLNEEMQRYRHEYLVRYYERRTGKAQVDCPENDPGPEKK